jgi:hypothetical protein
MSCADLARQKTPESLVENVLVAGSPGVVGGPEKALKTSLSIDLAVSLATRTPFLGRFAVRKAVPVLFYSNEGGQEIIGGIVRRVCAARGLPPRPKNLTFVFEPVPLGEKDIGHLISVPIQDKGARVLFVDPVYFSIMTGGTRPPDEKSLFQMGGPLGRFSLACLKLHCTPVVLHHASSGIQLGQAMQLHHLQYAGFRQWAGQWLLLNKRTHSKEGQHRLVLNAGRRGGYGGQWDLEVDEKAVGEELTGWDVRVKPRAGEKAGAGATPAAEAGKTPGDPDRRIREDAETVRQAREELAAKGVKATWAALKKHTRLNGSRLSAAIKRLKAGSGDVPQGPAGSVA